MVIKEHPLADFVNLPSGFVNGSMSDVDFSNWVSSSPESVKKAVICDIAWWRARKRPFHHQFLILTIAYRPHDGVPTELLMVIDGVDCGPRTLMQNQEWIEHGGQVDIEMFGDEHTVTVLLSGDNGVGSNGVGPGTHTVFMDRISVVPVDALPAAPALCPILP